MTETSFNMNDRVRKNEAKWMAEQVLALREALRETNICVEDLMVGIKDFNRAEMTLLKQSMECQKRILRNLRRFPYYREERQKSQEEFIANEVLALREAFQTINIGVEKLLVGLKDFGCKEMDLLRQTKDLQIKTLRKLRRLLCYREKRPRVFYKRTIELEQRRRYFKELPLSSAYDDADGKRDRDVNFIIYKMRGLSLWDSGDTDESDDSVDTDDRE